MSAEQPLFGKNRAGYCAKARMADGPSNTTKITGRKKQFLDFNRPILHPKPSIAIRNTPRLISEVMGKGKTYEVLR